MGRLLLFFTTPIMINYLLLSLLLQCTNAFDIEYRLTTTCNVQVSLDNSEDKQAYEHCTKQSVNRFLKLLTPDPEWRFEHVDDISTTLDGNTTIIVSAFDLLEMAIVSPVVSGGTGGSGGGLYFTANYYNDEPIPDTFRRGLRGSATKEEKGKNKKGKQDEGQDGTGTGIETIGPVDEVEDFGDIPELSDASPTDTPDEEAHDGFENEFRVQFRDRLIKCLEHKKFFDDPHELDDYKCSGSMETIITP